MRKLTKLIDEDIVATLNNGRRASAINDEGRRLIAILLSIAGIRITWVKLIGPILLASIPIFFLPEPEKAYWAFACMAVLLSFFCLYFYRFALIRQRWLDKHRMDEFGRCNASPDEMYELPTE